MQQAKCSEADIERIKDWLAKNAEDEDVRLVSGMSRLFWGYIMLFDNVCDPNLPHLEYKPEIKRAIDQHPHLTAACQLAKSAIEVATEMGVANSSGLVAAHEHLCRALESK